MTKKNDFILNVLNVVSWIIFIGLCIESGFLIFNFILTLLKPIVTDNIHNGLNLSEIYESQFVHYIGVMSFVMVLSILKAYLFYFVVKILMKLNLVNPFNTEIGKLIEKISFEAFAIAIVSVIAHQYTKWLIQAGHEVGRVEKFWDDGMAFLMMAAIIYVIAQIFKKGIELQNENELTV